MYWCYNSVSAFARYLISEISLTSVLRFMALPIFISHGACLFALIQCSHLMMKMIVGTKFRDKTKFVG